MSSPADAAVAAAAAVGLDASEPVVIRDLTNVLVHLAPEPVVARVSLTLAVRGRGALESELAFARFAAAAGAPVVPPAYGSVVEHEGYLVTFWQYVEHRRAEPDDARAIGRALRELHDAVAGYDAPLPRFDRLEEVEAVATAIEHPDAPLMRAAVAAAREQLAGVTLQERAIHGDAHTGNVLVTPDGPLWSDLENVCRGPVEYDLACLAWRARVHGGPPADEALRAYGWHDPALVDALMPALAAFLVPWNTLIVQRSGVGEDRFLRDRIEFLKTFT